MNGAGTRDRTVAREPRRGIWRDLAPARGGGPVLLSAARGSASLSPRALPFSLHLPRPLLVSRSPFWLWRERWVARARRSPSGRRCGRPAHDVDAVSPGQCSISRKSPCVAQISPGALAAHPLSAFLPPAPPSLLGAWFISSEGMLRRASLLAARTTRTMVTKVRPVGRAEPRRIDEGRPRATRLGAGGGARGRGDRRTSHEFRLDASRGSVRRGREDARRHEACEALDKRRHGRRWAIAGWA